MQDYFVLKSANGRSVEKKEILSDLSSACWAEQWLMWLLEGKQRHSFKGQMLQFINYF
jgi:hypothetical protein